MEPCVFCREPVEQGVCRACGRAQMEILSEGAPRPGGVLSQVCPSCGQAAQPGAHFCSQCATPLWQPCPACRQEVPLWASFWPQCAYPLRGQPSSSVSREVIAWPVVQVGESLARFSGLPSASSAPQVGEPTVPSAPTGPQSGFAAQAAGKAAGRHIGSKLLSTAVDKALATIGVVIVVLEGSLLGLRVAGKGQFVSSTNRAALGSIKEFALPTSDIGLYGIIIGPDGNLWFTECAPNASDPCGNQIGRITPGGNLTEFAVPTAESEPYDITAGPDGNLWFAEWNSDKIGWISPGT